MTFNIKKKVNYFKYTVLEIHFQKNLMCPYFSAVPQPATSARPYIPQLPDQPPPPPQTTLTLDDLEAVERKTIERYMKEQRQLSGEVLSSERTPPGLFAFLDRCPSLISPG